MTIADLKNKKIEYFVDNGIDRYRRKNSAKVGDMIKIYLDNNGFFVLMDEEFKFVGYLDVVDADSIKKLLDNYNSYKDKTIQEILDSKELLLRVKTIEANTSVIETIEKLDCSKQIYFPVVKNGFLVGRVSKDILKKKLEEF